MQKREELAGVLLIDKPQGLTSHDVVDRVRRKLKIKKVGHAGTLDPMATGLLVILVGKATKLSQQLMSSDKAYSGTIKLGETTNTYDAEGEIEATAEVPELGKDDLRSMLLTFGGDQKQTPPMFSAKKVKGVPLYKLARKGQEIEREPQLIHISKIELLSYDKPFVKFYLECTKGTYVRSLAHDFGQKVGCGAHLTELRRMASGHFSIEEALSLDVFEEMGFNVIGRQLIPLHKALPDRIL